VKEMSGRPSEEEVVRLAAAAQEAIDRHRLADQLGARRRKQSATASSEDSRTVTRFNGFELVMATSRARTRLGVQGDHLSSLAMIKRAVTRIYRHLIRDIRLNDYTEAALSRDKVIQFAIQLGRLDRGVDEHADKNLQVFMREIDRFYTAYNLSREKKKEITGLLVS